MTIEEILRRIVRAHLNTILACALIPLAVVALVELRTAPTYTAQVRVQTNSSAPGSSTEAEGLSSRVLAVATTPQVAQAALLEAGETHSAEAAVDMSTHRITVERLGESPVVVLSVLGHDPRAVSRTVSALARRVVSFMNDGSRGAFDGALSQARNHTDAARTRRDRLLADLDTTDGLQARENLQLILTSAQRELDSAETAQATLVLNDVNRDLVVPVDAGNPTVDRVPSALVPRSALAVLLGLLVGLAAAVTLETMRPRIAGIRVLARTLDAPILGSTNQRAESLAGSMSLAARRQGVETVVLVGVDDRDEKMTRQLLSGMLQSWQEGVLPAASVAVGPVPGGRSARGGGDAVEDTVTMSSRVRFTDRYGVTPAEEPTAGVVVVSAGTARRTSLDDVQDLVRAMRWPVVGVVEVAPRRGWLVSP
jgi:capsular polysaccharide biosynthesis protein